MIHIIVVVEYKFSSEEDIGFTDIFKLSELEKRLKDFSIDEATENGLSIYQDKAENFPLVKEFLTEYLEDNGLKLKNIISVIVRRFGSYSSYYGEFFFIVECE